MAITPCPDECAIQIDIDQAAAIYDMYEGKIRKSLQEDLTAGRINATSYATSTAALLQSVINSSLQAVVGIQTKETAADRALKQANTDQVKYQTENILPQDLKVKQANEAVLIRQEEGFDDSLRQKAFDSQMNAWAMMFSSGLLESVPCFISGDAATDLYKGMMEKQFPDTSGMTDEACCTAAGGTWDGSTCTLPPSQAEIDCIADGGTWNGVACVNP